MAKEPGYNQASKYYGPYNSLPHDLLPKEEGFLIEPQFIINNDFVDFPLTLR